MLQKKHKVIFDSDEERLATELVSSADLEVSNLVEEDKFGGRVALSAATQGAKGKSEPLDPLRANLASEVPPLYLVLRL